MARRKHTQRPPVLSTAEILEELRANFYALVGFQTANAKSTEEKYSRIDLKRRKNVTVRIKQKFAGLRPDQSERQRKQKGARHKGARKNGEQEIQ